MALFKNRLIKAPYSWCYAKNNGFFFFTDKGAQVFAPCEGTVKDNILTKDNIDVIFFNVDIKDGKYQAGSVLGLAKDNVGIAVKKNGEYTDAFCYLVGIDDYEYKVAEEPIVEEKKASTKKAQSKKKVVVEEEVAVEEKSESEE